MEEIQLKIKLMCNHFIKSIPLVLILMALTAISVYAGTIDATAAPDSTTSNTLADIYDRLTTGSFHDKSSFTEPQSGPGSGTMNSLDDIYSVANPGAIMRVVPRTGDNYNDELVTGEDGETRYGIAWTKEPTSGMYGAFTITQWTGVRFTDNGDGTVTDNLTGLIWVKDINCIFTDYGEDEWYNAFSHASILSDGICGLEDGSSAGDWRIPNINELHSFFDISQGNPALPAGHPFENAPTGNGYDIWSSTTHLEYYADDVAYHVDFENGNVDHHLKDDVCYMLFVRGGI